MLNIIQSMQLYFILYFYYIKNALNIAKQIRAYIKVVLHIR
jgi:hypothetical protein